MKIMLQLKIHILFISYSSLDLLLLKDVSFFLFSPLSNIKLLLLAAFLYWRLKKDTPMEFLNKVCDNLGDMIYDPPDPSTLTVESVFVVQSNNRPILPQFVLVSI